MKKAHDGSKFTWSPFVWPSREDVYDRKKALKYWLGLSRDDSILYLSRDMLSSSAHIRISVDALSSEPDKDKIILFERKTSLAEVQKELSELYDIVYELMSILYFYGVNREKASGNSSSKGGQQSLPLELPTKFSKVYLSFLTDWYQQTPEKFLSIVIPLFEEKLSQLGSLVEQLHSETDINNILLGAGKLTLR